MPCLCPTLISVHERLSRIHGHRTLCRFYCIGGTSVWGTTSLGSKQEDHTCYLVVLLWSRALALSETKYLMVYGILKYFLETKGSWYCGKSFPLKKGNLILVHLLSIKSRVRTWVSSAYCTTYEVDNIKYPFVKSICLLITYYCMMFFSWSEGLSVILFIKFIFKFV